MTDAAVPQSRRGHAPIGAVARILATTMLVALAACQPAGQGDSVDEPTAVFFGLADIDDNAAISLAEWDALSDRLFVKLDADGDGQLTGDELRRDFDVFDLNGDGVITSFEAPLLIQGADLDGDVLVDRQEYQRFDWGSYAADVNGNGSVTPQELRRSRRDSFHFWDLNLNEMLHRDEIEEFVVPMVRIPF